MYSSEKFELLPFGKILGSDSCLPSMYGLHCLIKKLHKLLELGCQGSLWIAQLNGYHLEQNRIQARMPTAQQLHQLAVIRIANHASKQIVYTSTLLRFAGHRTHLS